MSEQLRTTVREIPPLDPEEARHQADALDWIASGEPLYRTAKPATPPKHLVAYAALVDPDRQSMLLIDHRDAQRWLPTGGHIEVDEQPAAAAARELREELGIEPAFLAGIGARPLLLTCTETGGRSAGHTDVSLWFAFAGSEDLELEPDEGEFAGVRWWAFDEITPGPTTRFDPHLPRFIEKLRPLSGR